MSFSKALSSSSKIREDVRLHSKQDPESVSQDLRFATKFTKRIRMHQAQEK